ncbi:MAG: tol-pal system protein YbgF [Methylomonas sp.]
MVGLYMGAGAAAHAQPNAAGAAGQPVSDSALYDILSQVEQLQSEVRQLRGMVEEQSQTIADLERKQRNMYTDLDGRLQAVTPTTSASQTAQPPAPAANGQPQTGAAPLAAAPATAVAPAVTAAGQPAQNTPATAAVVAPAANTAAPAVSANGNEKERYQTAYDALRDGHNDQAIKLFDVFLADFPAGEYADNAQYWQGEAYKMNREYDKARQAFNKVVNQYPNSPKVPDALLKIAYIEADLQNYAKARDYLTRVNNSYPGTTAAHLAAKKLAQMTQ